MPSAKNTKVCLLQYLIHTKGTVSVSSSLQLPLGARKLPTRGDLKRSFVDGKDLEALKNWNRRHTGRRWIFTGICTQQLLPSPSWSRRTWESCFLPSSTHRSHSQDVKHPFSAHPLSDTAKAERAGKLFLKAGYIKKPEMSEGANKPKELTVGEG